MPRAFAVVVHDGLVLFFFFLRTAFLPILLFQQHLTSYLSLSLSQQSTCLYLHLFAAAEGRSARAVRRAVITFSITKASAA